MGVAHQVFYTYGLNPCEKHGGSSQRILEKDCYGAIGGYLVIGLTISIVEKDYQKKQIK